MTTHSRTSRAIVYAGVGAIAAVLLINSALVVGADLYSEWLTVQAVLQGGDPYQHVDALSKQYGDAYVPYPFAVPRMPGALLLAMPLAAVSPDWVPLVGVFGVTMLATLGAVAFARLAGIHPAAALAALPVLFLSTPGAEIADQGHISIMALAPLIGWAWLLLSRGDDEKAGVLLGVAATLKLFPWLIAAALLARRPRSAAAAGGTFLLLNGLGLFLPSVHLDGTVRSLSAAMGFLTHPRNGSPTRILGLPFWLPLTVAAAFLLWIWLRRIPWEHSFRLAVPLSLMTAPVVWGMYLPVLLLPLGHRRRFALIATLLLGWVGWFITVPRFNPIYLLVFVSLLAAALDEFLDRGLGNPHREAEVACVSSPSRQEDSDWSTGAPLSTPRSTSSTGEANASG